MSIPTKTPISFVLPFAFLVLTGVLFGEGLVVNAETRTEKAALSRKQMEPELKVRFLISEPCSLVRFVETISDRDHTTSWLKNWYFEKRGADAALDKEMLQKYQAFGDKARENYHFKDVTQREMDLSQYIACVAAQSENLDGLMKSLKSKLKSSDYLEFKKTYEYFYPYFHKLVWQPRLAKLEEQLHEFVLGTEKSKMNERLEAVQSFMNTRWLKNTPFDVVLVPLPEANQHSTHGESIGKTQIVELLVVHDFKDQSDVVFHEGCHSLWGRKKDLDQLRLEFEKNGGVRAYSELNEGLATALGQGWFYEQAFGEVQKHSWYNDDFIDKYARGLFPLVSEYMKDKRVLDAEFAKRATEIFNKDFPDALRSVKLSSSLYVCVDELPKGETELKNSIHAAMPRLHSLGISSPIKYSERFKSYESERAVVLMPLENLDKLSKAGMSESQISFLKRQDGKASCLRVGDRDVVFCIADKYPQQKSLFLACIKEDQWPQPTKTD